jgi:lipoprotein NlpD
MSKLGNVFRLMAMGAVAAALCACATRVPLDVPERPLPPLVQMPAPLPAPMAAPPAPMPPPPAAPQLAPGAAFMRPVAGRVIARFAEPNNPGVDFGGSVGDLVVASRDGRVVLVSSALPNYGTMVVIKHDDTYITAYAHLSRVLVAENELVRAGQPIAEMGSSGADQVKLHFEIRKMGAAVDPEPYLQGLAR